MSTVDAPDTVRGAAAQALEREAAAYNAQAPNYPAAGVLHEAARIVRDGAPPAPTLDADIAESLITVLQQLPVQGAPDAVRAELAARDRAIGQLSRFVEFTGLVQTSTAPQSPDPSESTHTAC